DVVRLVDRLSLLVVTSSGKYARIVTESVAGRGDRYGRVGLDGVRAVGVSGRDVIEIAVKFDRIAESAADHRYHHRAYRTERICVEASLASFRPAVNDGEMTDRIDIDECAADRRCVIVASAPGLLDQH